MKTVQMTVSIKTGLPNYSSRSTEVTVVADEGESLDIEATAKQLADQIGAAWNGKPKAANKTATKKAAKAAKTELVSDAVKDILG